MLLFPVSSHSSVEVSGAWCKSKAQLCCYSQAVSSYSSVEGQWCLVQEQGPVMLLFPGSKFL